MSRQRPRFDLATTYWLATVPLVSGAALHCRWSLAAALILTTVQAIHFAVRAHDPTAFPVQVRSAYFALLLLGTCPAFAWVHWLQLVGTTARVAANYCLLARGLSLLPWNRTAPFTIDLLSHAFFAPPPAASECSNLSA